MATKISTHSQADADFFTFLLDGNAEVAKRVVRGVQGNAYDNVAFAVGNGVSDYNVSTNQASLWSNIVAPTYVSIRTDQTITIKLNSDSNADITVSGADSPFSLDGLLAVSNIYITNSSGSVANVEIFMV